MPDNHHPLGSRGTTKDHRGPSEGSSDVYGHSRTHNELNTLTCKVQWVLGKKKFDHFGNTEFQ